MAVALAAAALAVVASTGGRASTDVRRVQPRTERQAAKTQAIPLRTIPAVVRGERPGARRFDGKTLLVKFKPGVSAPERDAALARTRSGSDVLRTSPTPSE